MNVNLTILGGDNREVELAVRLNSQGFKVKMVGFDNYPQKIPVENISIAEGISRAQVIIAPLPGTDNNGILYAKHAKSKIVIDEDIIKHVKPGTLFIIGSTKPFLKKILQAGRINFIEVAEMDEIAILNSIPTAEGALQKAMEETEITIHNSRSMVIGFGRCGFTLSRMLYGIGAKVTVASRNEVSLARAWEMGFNPLSLNKLEKDIGKFEIIFNTVPALVLDKALIERISTNTVIIDIAAYPGGTDFEAADKRGIKAKLVLGLPGLVAPKTAGQILAQIYPRLIKKYLC
ncbi:MAG: dipicolinic acid synthetase subunit A [Firmicutes bacterium HGW-Firmicutes-13]|nr:MAG: dipicolinic acid synthetase subunit A [Firmicutes bacterium HGW-Firmicutes-13]